MNTKQNHIDFSCTLPTNICIINNTTVRLKFHTMPSEHPEAFTPPHDGLNSLIFITLGLNNCILMS